MNNKQRFILVLMAVINGIALAVGLTTEVYSMLVFAVQSLTIFTFLSMVQSRDEEIAELQKKNEELKKQVELAKNQEYHALTNQWRIKYTEVKSENDKLDSLILKIRDTIEKNHPEYFDDWVGEFVHSPAVCLERVYLFLKGETK